MSAFLHELIKLAASDTNDLYRRFETSQVQDLRQRLFPRGRLTNPTVARARQRGVQEFGVNNPQAGYRARQIGQALRLGRLPQTRAPAGGGRGANVTSRRLGRPPGRVPTGPPAGREVMGGGTEGAYFRLMRQ